MAMERGSPGTRSSPADDSELWATALSDPLDVGGMSSSTPPSESDVDGYGLVKIPACMAMQRGSPGTRSSPADDSELWAAALSDPLDVGMSSSTPPSEIYANVDHGTMDIQQLLQGPRDEHDLERWLEGAISALRSSKAEEQLYLRLQLWNQLTSPTNMKEVDLTHEAVPATTQPEKQGTCAASTVDLLDYLPKNDWRSRCGLRAPRKRRTLNAAGLLHDMPSASKGRRHGLRKNNKHWTLEEVAKLVDGLEEYKVGQWTQLKKQKFSGSIRTKDHLKDKWRNLLEAYTVEPTSKKKGNAQRRFLVPLDTTLIERIKKLAAEHPCISKIKVHLGI